MQTPIVSTLIADEPDLLDLVEQFIQRLPETISKITDAIDSGDLGTAKKEIHDLKGMGGNFGFPVLSQIAKQIETEINLQQLDSIATLLQELKSILLRIQLGHGS